MEKIKIPIGQQDIPNSFEPYKSFALLYGAPNLKNNTQPLKFLEPAPRNQLGVPSNHHFKKNYNLKSYYRSPLGNGNFERGNQFASYYPYSINNGIIEYSGKEDENNNVIVANSPFYPFPGQKLMKKDKYRTYPHKLSYIDNQPIFNYPYDKREGIVENFEDYKISFNFTNLIFVFLILFIIAFFIFRK